MLDIHKHNIGLLSKAIKIVLSFMAWSWEMGHWMPPNKQLSCRDMINKLLFTYVTNFLAVKPRLTRILVNMDLGPLYVVRRRTI
jgi:hypothetical protein